ncbi:MAG: hypothetical protein ACREFP_18865, partial [Acetobacteraceae bacterium]
AREERRPQRFSVPPNGKPPLFIRTDEGLPTPGIIIVQLRSLGACILSRAVLVPCPNKMMSKAGRIRAAGSFGWVRTGIKYL